MIVDENKKQAIADFLAEFKAIVVRGRGLDVIPRRENNQALIDLGITAKIRKEEILLLSVEDYCEGPRVDRDRPGYMWFFGKKLNCQEVYIKLKIAQVDGIKIAKCISFHPAKSPLIYPCRQK